jgi:hypothetical protein
VNTIPDYHNTEIITTVKRFIVQDPPGQTANMPDEEEEKSYQSSCFSCETIDLKEYT